MRDWTDAELVARFPARDEAALSELYDRHAGALHGFALHALHDAHAATELVQDVFLTLWERPEKFDAARGDVRGFLLVMARSRALDRLRRVKPTLPLYDEDGDDFPLEDERADVARDAEDRQRAAHGRGALGALSAAHRETVERAFFRAETREEIAAAMNVPVGTVKSRLKYALDKLRVQLGALGEGR